MAEGIEGLNPTLDSYLSDISRAQEGIGLADREAIRLREIAEGLRTAARERHLDLFEAAGQELVSEVDAGILTPLGIVTAVARLRDLDPTEKPKEDEGKVIIDAFKSLTTNTPVINLAARREEPVVGIVQGEPKEITVHTRPRRPQSNSLVHVLPESLAPWATFKLSLLRVKDGDVYGTAHVEEVKVELSALRRAHIGHNAIQALVTSATFKTHRDTDSCHPNNTSNGLSLRTLRRDIAMLQALGAEGFDTTNLDEAIGRDREWSAEQNRAVFGRHIPRGRR